MYVVHLGEADRLQIISYMIMILRMTRKTESRLPIIVILVGKGNPESYGSMSEHQSLYQCPTRQMMIRYRLTGFVSFALQYLGLML